MTDLKKLLVIVRAAQHDSFVKKYITPEKEQNRDTSYDTKVVFLEKTQEIFTQGKLYGGGADIKALKDILAGYSADAGSRATTVAGDIDAMLAKLSTSNVLSLSYNTTSGQYDVQSYLGIKTNATSYALELTGYNGYVFGSVNVASNNATFVEANNAYLTNVKGVTDYVTTQIGQLSGGMRYNGNTYITTQTGTSYTIGYFPWNAATSSMKPGDTAIADKDFVVLDENNNIVKAIETGDILIGKYPDPIEKEEGADEHGIKLTSETLSYVTIIERETDDMVTATTAFTEANRITYTTGEGHNIAQSAYTFGGETIAATPAATVLATEAAVATYAGSAASTAQANSYAYTKSEIEKLDVTAYTLSNNHVQFSYSEADGIVTVSDLTVTLNTPTWNGTTHQLTIPETDGLLAKAAADALNSYITYVGGLVDALDESYTTVKSATQQLTSSLPATYYMKVEDTGTGNDHEYTVTAYLKTLGNAVGMYCENGVWKAAGGTITSDGLVTAYDVAYEIVADEKVIAAALNEHETKIINLQNAAGEASDIHNGVYAYAYTLGGVIKGVDVTTWNAVLSYANGDITVTNASYFMNGDGDLNAIKAYAVAQGDAAKAAAQTAIDTAIQALDNTVTYAATTNGVGATIVETDGKLTSVETYWSAPHAIAYLTYSVEDVAKAVYDPWETFSVA